MSDKPETSVLFNAECPICNFEISHYRDYSEREGLPIRFDDLNGPDLAQWGLDADTAARRLYVLHKGEMLGGIDGFVVLWREMPRYRWLARVVGVPGVYRLACLSYDWVLAPLIYRWHLRRKARAAG